MKPVEVAIIGAGPAGIAAAIQLKRQGVDFLLFERDEVGGLLLNANLVENYPGFPGGIRGTALVKLLRRHLESLDIPVISEEVELIEEKDGVFVIITPGGRYCCNYLLAASGTSPKTIELPFIDEESKNNVYYEIRSIQDQEGQHIAIIGAGDAAFDYALNLARHNTVSIHNRSNRISCLTLLQERADKNDRIRYHSNSIIHSLAYRNGRLELKWKEENGIVAGQADFLICATGRQPNLSYLSESLREAFPRLEEANRLKCIGDVQNGLFRQAVIAAGDGLKAAMEIRKQIQDIQ